MSGFGGKSGRRGGSERKKKPFSPQIPPQALFPQPPPSSNSTHTPQTHTHTPYLPECSRKRSIECSRKGSIQQQSAIPGLELWNSRCEIFCRQRVKQWPIVCVRSGDLSATVPLFIIVAQAAGLRRPTNVCSQTILKRKTKRRKSTSGSKNNWLFCAFRGII